MTKIKLNEYERTVEKDLIRGKFHPVSSMEFESIARAITQRKKDAVLNIRINNQDLKQLKLKAKKLGVPYQTFISEILRRFAA
ncbi:MAG: hypothetical protein HYU97_11035 [Deltaproteobacteria bacterium]|nr:hypothetical protein [Deltaproteobacteria bacterium]